MTTIGRYRILEKLGNGSMGIVYTAYDAMLDRQVALKTIRTGADVDDELRERFYREARACARLQHPGIVAVYDLGEADRTAFIAMELLAGSDFRKLIESREPIPGMVKIEAMIQVAEALAHAHRHGIIHRDIKPSNLFLVEQRRAKILDFGIARLPSSKLTVAGKILGTPNYMAPEQLLGKPPDARSDLFSAAVVFFEWLVYKHPFHADLIPKRVVEGHPDALFDHDPTLPIVLDRIFSRALATDPEERYPNGDELAVDLRAVLDAIRQNASPTFSRFELPSQRGASLIEKPQVRHADPSLLTQPPAGEDPHEWRMSEILRLLPDFEKVVDEGDAGRAAQILAQLEAIEAIDNRFAEAVELCRKRYGAMPKEAPREVPVAAPAGVSPGAQRTAGMQTGAPASARDVPLSDQTIRWDQTVSMPLPPGQSAPPVSQIRPNPTWQPVSTQNSPPQPPPSQAASPAAKAAPSRQAFKVPKTAIFGIASAIACVVVAFAIWMLWPVRAQPAEGTATVAAEHSQLFKNANGPAGIAALSRGDRLNVLKLPSSPTDQWVPAQLVTSRAVSKPGFVRMRDLDPDGWEAKDPDQDLRLVLMLHSGESSSETEIQNEIAVLSRLRDRAEGKPAGFAATLAIARLELALAAHMKESGQPQESWSRLVESARTRIATAVSGNGALAGQGQTLQARADELIPPPPAAAATDPAQPARTQTPAPERHESSGSTQKSAESPVPRDAAALIAEARRLFNLPGPLEKQLANLRTAESLLNRALVLKPGDPEAMGLHEKVLETKHSVEVVLGK